MGHGEQVKDGTYLYFEKDNGDLDLVETEQLIAKIHGTPFLITLNACASASPGPTAFSNLAASLVKAKVPYTLGMRFRIYDDDALVFSRTFYTELAQGAPIEEALLQTRRSLAKRPRTWTVGVPVLYTSLATPTGGFVQHTGTFHIDEHQPRIEASGVARAIGTFQGRTDDLKRLGNLLTGDHRPRILTIHGGGGQGKTALAREAIIRFAYAWPDGIWGIMLDPLPDRPGFVSQLAQFLEINVQETPNPKDLERQVLRLLAARRILLVLDNAETLVDAIEANNSQASLLAEFIQQLPSTSVSLLITSRIQLGWLAEITQELGGLTPEEGVLLFRQYVPDRLASINMDDAQELSKKIEGHPLGLRLLAGAFNASSLPLHAFIEQYEEQLVRAENTYVGEEHRHRKLYASIETSIRYLSDELRNLLSKLWIFQAPFMPDTAITIFDPGSEEIDNIHSPVHTQLKILWQRGLLSRMTITTSDGAQDLYYLLPTTRPYIQTYLHNTMPKEELFHRYGEAYEKITNVVHAQLDHNVLAVAMAQQMEKDLEQGIHYAAAHRQGYYKVRWALILSRLGKPYNAQAILEEVLEQVQGYDQQQEFQVLNGLGQVYQGIGQPQQALALFEQALLITHEDGDRTGEATILNNMAVIFKNIGQPQRALSLFEQALLIRRDVGNRAGEATTLTNMANVHQGIGQPQQALALFEQALSIRREIGNRAGEANTLNNMANVYRDIGQPQQALALFEQALPITREVGNRQGEATILHNVARVYQNIGQPQQALALFEQALLIRRDVGDRDGEAHTLTNMANVSEDIGQPQRALTLSEQALPIMRDIGDRAGEATTLNNMANVHQGIGQPQQALALFEQALPIMRDIGNRAGEAATLNNMANVHQGIGQPQQALALFEQALAITRDVGDRAGEATTLTNIGYTYQGIGQPQQALALFEQALPIMRDVGNRDGEAHTLNNMANVHQGIGQPQRALALFEQALPITREVGNRTGEATILNNMASIYHATGQPERALALYEQTLPITRDVGNRAGEATTLNNMGHVYQDIGQPQEALALFKQALSITREIGNRAGEASILTNMAILLYKYLERQPEALHYLQQAQQLLGQYSLPQDATGRTLEQINEIQKVMQQGQSLSPSNSQQSTLPPDVQKQMIINTIAVMTKSPERHKEWYRRVETFLHDAQAKGPRWPIEIDFYRALLDILDGKRSSLSSDHSYASALLTIQKGIARKKTSDKGKK